jgi:hypothetical protein
VERRQSISRQFFFVKDRIDDREIDKGGELSNQKDVGRCVNKTASGIGISKDERNTDEVQ